VFAVVVPVLLLVLGAVLLTVGAEAFAKHVAAASASLGVSIVATGVLLAGAEPEEAVTATLAAAQGHPSLAAGDAIGANLVILTLTIGIAALLTRLPVSRRVVEYAAAAALVGALDVLFLWNGLMSRGEGAVLLLLYVAGVAWVWRREQQPPVIGEVGEDEQGEPGLPARPLLFLLLGLLGMVVGGFFAVRGAEGLVDVFGVTESVIGLTVLALATSAEMVALVWAARRRGVAEIVVAGAVGAVAYNATVSLGLAAVVGPLGIGRGSPIIVVGGATALLPLLLIAGRRSGSFPRPLGVVLVAAYLLTIGWLFAA